MSIRMQHIKIHKIILKSNQTNHLIREKTQIVNIKKEGYNTSENSTDDKRVKRNILKYFLSINLST